MTETDFAIVPMTAGHWPEVRRIYEEGIATGNATLETACPEWDQWDRTHVQGARLVARAGATVIGWAALTPVSGRCVYAGVAEVSVYIDAEHRGRGVGRALLRRLVEESEQLGIWTLQAGILKENVASIRAHEKAGFRLVGTRERLGKLYGVWRDIVLMERRSQIVGV